MALERQMTGELLLSGTHSLALTELLIYYTMKILYCAVRNTNQ